MSGVTISATVGSTAVSGNVVADDCNNNSEEEAPLRVVDDATEMVYCTANGAVDKAKESLQALNGDSDCIMWQESNKPYNVFFEEHCDIDHSWDGDGCGKTSYSVTEPSENKRRHNILLSDSDTDTAIYLLNNGVPIAVVIASVSAGFAAGPYAAAIMAGAGLAVNHKAHDWAHKLDDKNDGCGVGITIEHRKIHDSDRSNPFDDIYESGNELSAEASTQDGRVQ
jgi:hypothetical protein